MLKWSIPITLFLNGGVNASPVLHISPAGHSYQTLCPEANTPLLGFYEFDNRTDTALIKELLTCNLIGTITASFIWFPPPAALPNKYLPTRSVEANTALPMLPIFYAQTKDWICRKGLFTYYVSQNGKFEDTQHPPTPTVSNGRFCHTPPISRLT